MSYKIGLIHATLNAVQPINDAMRRYVPDTTSSNFLDEGLIEDLNARGQVTPSLLRRFIRLVEKAEEAGVDGALLSCSSLTPYVPLVSQLFEFPIVSVDYSMLEEAVHTGRRIAVIATVVTAAPITEQILQQIADEHGKDVEIHSVTIIDAFTALQQGDVDMHNQLIWEQINELASTHDVIVLAQISMTRAIEGVELPAVPVLTSPESSIRTLLQLLQAKP